MTYATGSGRITEPGGDSGIRARLIASPETTSGALRFPAEDRITWGPQIVETDDDGVLPDTFKIPLDSDMGDDVIWRFTVEPLENSSLPKRWVLAKTTITGDFTIAEITNVDLIAVTSDFGATVAENAASAAASAEAAAAVGATHDAQTAANVTTGPLTGAALSASNARSIAGDEEYDGTPQEAVDGRVVAGIVDADIPAQVDAAVAASPTVTAAAAAAAETAVDDYITANGITDTDFTGQLLLLPGAAGAFATVSVSPVTGDLDVRLLGLTQADWTPAASVNLAGQGIGTGNQRSWSIQQRTGGTIRLNISLDGTAVTAIDTATVTPGVVDGQSLAGLRITRVASTGAVKWYTLVAGVWTQYASATAATGNLFATTAAVEVGSALGGTSPVTGSVEGFELYSGVGGTLVASADFTDEERFSGRGGLGGVANPWAIRGTASLRVPALTLTKASDTYAIDRSSDVEKRIAAALAALKSPAPLVVENMQAGHGWVDTGSVGGTTTLNDTSRFLVGTQAVTRLSDGAGGVSRLRKLGGTTVDFTGKNPRFSIYTSALAKAGPCTLYLGSGGALANYYRWDLSAPGAAPEYFVDGQFTTFTLTFADATVVGTPDRSALSDKQVLWPDDNTGTPFGFTIGRVDAVAPSLAYPKAISFSFDDSFGSQAEALAYLGKYGMRGTLYTIVDVLGTAGCLTLSQLRQMHDVLGHEVAGHSFTAANHNLYYPNISSGALDTELSGLRAWLDANGFDINHFCYPAGKYNAAVIDAVRSYFPSSARGTFNAVMESSRPGDRHQLRAVSLNSGRTIANATGKIDKLVAGDDGWLHFYGHKFDGDGSIGWDFSKWTALVDYAAASGIPVLPVGDVLAAA
jgi:peptidoglycan/xylan/chitin deacetylase (PgdA/CDA1 family)